MYNHSCVARILGPGLATLVKCGADLCRSRLGLSMALNFRFRSLLSNVMKFWSYGLLFSEWRCIFLKLTSLFRDI